MSNNNQLKAAKLIIERWAADLTNKDRSHHNLLNNFEELFHDMWRASIPFEIVHDFMSEIIKHHLPSHYVAKKTYSAIKNKLQGQSFADFLEGWKKYIKSQAYQALYTFYPIENEEKTEKDNKFGNMSAQEYMKQRRYADSFPELDIEALKKQREKMMDDIDADFNSLEEEDGE